MAAVGFQEIGWKKAWPSVAWTLNWHTHFHHILLGKAIHKPGQVWAWGNGFHCLMGELQGHVVKGSNAESDEEL